jgi:hypothetical protein
MGWASYLEDIVDRLDDDLRSFRSRIVEARVSAPRIPTREDWDTILGWVSNAEHVLLELRSHLELATDPDSDPAAELIVVERQVRNLQLGAGELVSLKREAAKLREDNKRLRRDNRALRDRLDAAFKADPGSVYDAFSTPDMIRKHKRDR